MQFVTTESLIHVLTNLRIIRDNRDLIESNANMWLRYNIHHLNFSNLNGICTNANLWAICHDIILLDGMTHTIVLKHSLTSYVHCKFIESKGTKGLVNCINPVLEDGKAKWLNKQRWELVDFWIDFIEKMLDNPIEMSIEIASDNINIDDYKIKEQP